MYGVIVVKWLRSLVCLKKKGTQKIFSVVFFYPAKIFIENKTLNSICDTFFPFFNATYSKTRTFFLFLSSRLVQVHGWNLHDLRMAFLLFFVLFSVVVFCMFFLKFLPLQIKGDKNTGCFSIWNKKMLNFSSFSISSGNLKLLFFSICCFFHESTIILFNGFLVGVKH